MRSRTRSRSLALRFFAKVNKRGPLHPYDRALGRCWLWTGGKRRRGYNVFWFDGRLVSASDDGKQKARRPKPAGTSEHMDDAEKSLIADLRFELMRRIDWRRECEAGRAEDSLGCDRAPIAGLEARLSALESLMRSVGIPCGPDPKKPTAEDTALYMRDYRFDIKRIREVVAMRERGEALPPEVARLFDVGLL